MGMSEKKLERYCCQLAESKGWVAMKLVSPNRAGVPDRIFLGPKNGEVLFVEFKGPNGVVSKIQSRCIDDWRVRGLNVQVIDSVNMFERMLELMS